MASVSATNAHAAMSFTYDSDGLRLTKTVGAGSTAVTHSCTWQGSTLIAEAYGTIELEFFYDESGSPYALLVRDVSAAKPTEAWYYYVTNLQGDVVMVVDASGTPVAEYSYNAWGEVLSATGTMASINPLRYRGYYYDAETGLYYVSSRYYDPEIGRFINADSYASTGQGVIGANMFAYCGNNPVNAVDPTGHGWITNIIEKIKELLKKTVVGCARPYEEYQNYTAKPGQSMQDAYADAVATRPNCYAYAIGVISKGINPGYYSGISLGPFNSLETVASAVEADMKALGRSIRRIDGPYAPVNANEYRIALRVGEKPFAYSITTDGQYVFFNDYHFMVQTDSGRWAEKHGSMGASVLHNIGETPDTIAWTLDNTGYYDSDIIYYAIGG